MTKGLMDGEQIIRVIILGLALLLIGLGWYGYYISEVKLITAVLNSVGMVFSSIGLIQRIVNEGNAD
ncbi:hypothetical protein DN752_16860 [Echinicola strongylocentroti]|uniref:Uncharacterized protein n=2 Tax=Echinicola strongylocentroti TaxID=1795355 RepID=A0A2Z4IKL4_9BACT|nr:hypothetical protein DN752_16860 [Echinicola strongylocentroti]